MTDYATVEQLRSFLKDDSTFDEDTYQIAVTAASRQVDALTDRVFVDNGQTTRFYAPDDFYCVEIDDFSSSTGLTVAVDYTYNNTYSTTLVLNTDYICEPVNLARGGIDFPYTQLRTIGYNVWFPKANVAQPYPIKVTSSHWGWNTVPTEVVRATLILAADHVRAAPFGIAGFDAYGAMRVRQNPQVTQVLSPFLRAPIATG